MKVSSWATVNMIMFGILGVGLGLSESTTIISVAIMLSASQICRAIEGKK